MPHKAVCSMCCQHIVLAGYQTMYYGYNLGGINVEK